MTDLDRAYVLGPGDTVLPEDKNEYIRVLVSGEQSLGQYALLTYVMDHDAAPHVHELEDESVFVLEGEITVRIGPKSYDVGPGGFAFMPKNVPHAITLHTPTWKGYSISAPGGIFDNIIRDRSAARTAGEVLDEEALWRIRERYGMHRVDTLTEGLEL